LYRGIAASAQDLTALGAVYSIGKRVIVGTDTPTLIANTSSACTTLHRVLTAVAQWQVRYNHEINIILNWASDISKKQFEII
jgi:hypothetical protein